MLGCQSPQVGTWDTSLRVAAHRDCGAVGGDAEIECGEVRDVELGDLAVLVERQLRLNCFDGFVFLVLLPGGAPVEEALAGGGAVEVVLELEVQGLQ